MTQSFNNTTLANELYPVATAITSSSPFVVVFQTRDPTTADIQYPIQKVWLNTATENFWFLQNFTTANGVLFAHWIPWSGITTVETLTGDDNLEVNPVANNIDVFGNVVANATHAKPVYFRHGSPPDGEIDLDVQVGEAADTSAIDNAGLASFSSVQFAVDPNGYVTLAGPTPPVPPILQFEVDASTPPGTNPVVADVTGKVTITGGQVAAGKTANVIRTDSLAANTYTVEIQRSQAVDSSTIGDNGVSHFNSAQFTVDDNGFVSIVGGLGFSSINNQVFTTSGTYTPTAGMVYCEITCLGGGAGGGGSPAVTAGQVAASGGGGSGEYAVGIFSAALIGASQSVTIGSGGAGGAAGGTNLGTNGGTTSVGVLITSGGGLGGTGATPGGTSNAAGGGGGFGGSGGDYRTGGNVGIAGFGTGTTGPIVSGLGASSQLGGGGSYTLENSTGHNAVGYGAGGGGVIVTSIASGYAGGNGSAGIVIIQEFIT